MAEPRLAVWHLDNLVERCGFFTTNTSVNNGYGCLHPEQEDIEPEELDPEEMDGVERKTCGRCYDVTCPIANSMNPRDPDDAEEFRACGMNPADYSAGSWMLVSLDAKGKLIGAKEVTDV